MEHVPQCGLLDENGRPKLTIRDLMGLSVDGLYKEPEACTRGVVLRTKFVPDGGWS
jgi:hypothetical protein